MGIASFVLYCFKSTHRIVHHPKDCMKLRKKVLRTTDAFVMAKILFAKEVEFFEKGHFITVSVTVWPATGTCTRRIAKKNGMHESPTEQSN